MSARQRARITKQNPIELPEGGSDTSESSEEETFKKVVTTKTFQFDSSSESSENESDAHSQRNSDASETVNSALYNTNTVGKPTLQSKPPEVKKVSSYDELEYLESVIEANVAIEKEIDTSMESLLFKVDDLKQFDVSAVLRRRQGQQAMFGGEVGPAVPIAGRHRGNGANRNRGLGRGPAAVLGTKKVIFGAPSDDWPRPPAFVAGGLGMRRETAASTLSTTAINTFTFEWSPEFQFLHSQFQFIISSGDANLLVMFLAHFPHHSQALLELSRVYAGLGQPDKSADLVRRALYVLECASLEAFKPSGALASRLGPGRQENAVYFDVLRRHLQLCSTQGCHGVAMEVCRYVVSLWPADTSHMLLVVLDHYLLMANRHDLMLAYCGFAANHAAPSPTDRPSSSLAQALDFSFCSPYRFESAENAGEEKGKEASLQDLPNWWYSLALSTFSAERRRPTASVPLSPTSTSPSTASATASRTDFPAQLPSASMVLKAALLRWPCVLRPLLAKIGVDVGPPGVMTLITGTSPAAQWRRILSHGVFAEAVDRIPIDLRGYLEKTSDVYAVRNAPLWGKEDELRWLLQCCTELLSEMGIGGPENSTFGAYLETQRAHYAHVRSVDTQGVLSKYEHARLADYSDAVPRFPDDLNPLDPSLDDIQYVLSGAVRFREFMDSEGRFLFPVPEPFVSTVKSSAASRNGNGRGQRGERDNGGLFGGLFGGAQREQRPDRANIDLNLPLMQLFLATFFPWIYVPPAPRN